MNPEKIQRAMRAAKADGNAAAYADLRQMLVDTYKDEYKNVAVEETKRPWAANLGAGLMDVWEMGPKQLLGMASGEDAREKARLDDALAEGMTGGKLLQLGGSALGLAPVAMAAPVLAPGAGAVPLAAGVGAAQGVLMPTQNDNVGLGKFQNAAVGALAGAAGEKYVAPVMDKVTRLPGVLRDAAVKRGIGTAAQKQRFADRAFASQFDDAGAAANSIVTGMRDEIPGVIPTTGQLTGNRNALGVERAAWATNTQAGQLLKQQSAQNNAARLGALRQQLDIDPDPIIANAGQFADDAKSLMKLKPGGVDPKGHLQGQFTYWENKVEAPEAKQLFASLRERIQAIRAAPEDKQLELLHQFRRTAIRDAQSKLFKSEKQAAKILRDPIKKLESSIDDAIQSRLESGDWKGFLKGYSRRMKVADQADAGRGVLRDLELRAPLSTGDPSLAAGRQTLRRALSPDNAQNAYGGNTFSPQSRQVMDDVLASIDRQQKAWAADVGPMGSGTAENLSFLKNLGAEMPTSNFAPGLGAALGWGVGAASGGNPLIAAGAGAALGYGERKLAHNASQQIATRLLTLHRDPQAALAVLKQASIPPQQKSEIARALLAMSRGLGATSAPAGAVLSAGALSSAQQ